MSKIKNYTSIVPAAISISKIEQCLVEFGATDISKKYSEDKICTGIVFRLIVNNIPLFFKLTAKSDACFRVLYAEYKKPNPEIKSKCKMQADRTAWKIISDWVDIQLSMIQLEQAELLQIFLPYAYDNKTDSTFYEKLKENDFKTLLLNP